MSRFSYSDLNEMGDIAVDSVNSIIAPNHRGDIVRVQSGDAFVENAPHHNESVLGPGPQGGILVEKPLTSIWASPGAIINRLVNINSDAVIKGASFRQEEGDSNNNQQLVIVGGNARVSFTDCTFQRIHTAERSTAASTRLCFVLIEDGAKAVFSNCVFLSDYETGAMDGSGFVIQNLNALATTVYVGTGINYTTHTHNNVTALGGEIT
tara:strand:+ start:837 stop:1463 length:627 start_codon:yes stop_codon:yes gene_type:complete